MAELSQRHREDLASSGLSDATIELSGCYSVKGSRAILGYEAGSGLVFPYPDAASDGSSYRRLKPDTPFVTKEGAAKYLSPTRKRNPKGNRAYFPSNLAKRALGDPSVPLILSEGEKKALAGNQAGFATVGLAGVACWVSRNGNGESHPIDDLDLVVWSGRVAYVVFDSDARTKVEVKREERKLALHLRDRGADVRVARLPKPTAAEDLRHALRGKFGMDDFIKVRGREAFASILKKARPVQAAEAVARRTPAADLADQFLDDRRLRRGATLLLRWWRDGFYRFTGTHFELLPDGDLRADINTWLQADPEHRGAAGTRVPTAIIQNLQAVTHVNSGFEPPVWLGRDHSDNEDVVLANGVISVADLLHGDLGAIRRHAPELFTLSALPFPLDLDADCPKWLCFLEQMLPDPEMQQLVQEMFGYLLVHDVSQEKFFLLEGAGANGKTVICTVLREILGPTNVCAVGLEAFSASRTFPLAATIGKKANIVEELDEIEKAAEGTLKNFVTAKPMTIERKNKDAFEFTPTARLVFATNVLPRFVDRTDGIWRRMILIPFREQVLDESKQEKRLIDPTWWRESGELPAIFLWAVGGLANLRKRGRFCEPDACRVEKRSYRRDSNPAWTFLSEHCATPEASECSSKTLYRGYHQWAQNSGYKPLGAAQFAKEVRRTFPRVELTENARRVAGGRSRVWLGLEYDGEA